jgi:hypothetical protein
VNLSSICEIEKTTLDLFEAAGFHDIESLAESELEALHAALNRVNLRHEIASSDPSRADLERWIGMARDLVGVADRAMGMSEPSPEVASSLSTAPFALPLPASSLTDGRLSIDDLPPLLNHSSGDLEVRVEGHLPRSLQPRRVVASEYIRLAEHSNSSQRLEIDTSRIQSTESFGQAKRTSSGGQSLAVDECFAVICDRREEDPNRRPRKSRRSIRGVLHKRPFSVTSGALVTLLVMIAVPCSLGAGALLFLSAESPGYFGWVPSWLLAVPIALPLLGVCYLIWGVDGSCRVCGQKLFVHRSHMKSPMAHRIRGLGYILPLCIHVLVFRWFRCTHCGTFIRLKD